MANAAATFLLIIPVSMIGFLISGFNPFFGWVALACTFGIGVCTSAYMWREFRKEYSRTRCSLYLVLMCLMFTIWIQTGNWFFACIPGVPLGMLIDRFCPN